MTEMAVATGFISITREIDSPHSHSANICAARLSGSFLCLVRIFDSFPLCLSDMDFFRTFPSQVLKNMKDV